MAGTPAAFACSWYPFAIWPIKAKIERTPAPSEVAYQAAHWASHLLKGDCRAQLTTIDILNVSATMPHEHTVALCNSFDPPSNTVQRAGCFCGSTRLRPLPHQCRSQQQRRTAEKSASSATSMYGTPAAMAASRTLHVSFHWNGPAVWITRSKPCRRRYWHSISQLTQKQWGAAGVSSTWPLRPMST